jgi:hypothetical protein
LGRGDEEEVGEKPNSLIPPLQMLLGRGDANNMGNTSRVGAEKDSAVTLVTQILKMMGLRTFGIRIESRASAG